MEVTVDVDLPPLTQAPVLREQVFDTLEDLIVRGVLPPGRPLPESELADRLGVSRNPVREALTLLAHAGFVDLRPRQVALVHEPTEKEVEDFFRIRVVLEEESARLAATNATTEDVAGLRELVASGHDAARRDDEPAMAAANASFHERISQLADNSVLDEVLDLMKRRLRWYFAHVARRRGVASWHEHEQLVDAIAAGDGTAAAAIMRAHSERTADLYRELQRREDATDTAVASSGRG